MVSVVIPTYNRCPFLLDVLISGYLRQSLVREIIIVDDCSDDGTCEAIKRLDVSKIRCLRNEKHFGLPFSRNKGIANSTCDFILFGEDDLYITKGHVEVLFKELHSHTLDIIAPRLISVISRSMVFKSGTAKPGQVIDMKTLTGNFDVWTEDTILVPFVHSCALIRAKVFAEERYYKGFKGNAFREETDFYLRCYAKGKRIGFTTRTAAYHLKNPETRMHGCGSNKSMKYRIQKHLNNLIFLYRNRKVIAQLTSDNIWKHELMFIGNSFKGKK